MCGESMHAISLSLFLEGCSRASSSSKKYIHDFVGRKWHLRQQPFRVIQQRTLIFHSENHFNFFCRWRGKHFLLFYIHISRTVLLESLGPLFRGLWVRLERPDLHQKLFSFIHFCAFSIHFFLLFHSLTHSTSISDNQISIINPGPFFT